MSRFIWIFSLISCFQAYSAVEFKTNFFVSYAQVGRSDVIAKSHNTLLIGSKFFKAGLYYGSDSLHGEVNDSTTGGAIRFGEKTYFELQAGTYTRIFSHTRNLTGRGQAGSLIFGQNMNDFFSLSLFFTGQHISSGMDKRWTYTALPYLGLRMEF